MSIIKKFKNRIVWQAYRIVFTSEHGRVVLRDMVKANHVLDGGFDPDPYINAFQSGERNAVLRILTILKMTPEEILLLDEED